MFTLEARGSHDLSAYQLSGVGRVIEVENPEDCESLSHFVGEEVMLDGKRVKVIAVELHGLNRPCGSGRLIRKGEIIGLLIADDD